MDRSGRPDCDSCQLSSAGPMRSCREALTGSAHQVKGHDRGGPRHQETTMPKYLLLKHYRGGPEPHRPVPPMDQWAPEDVEAHMAFLKHVSELLEENGEDVESRERAVELAAYVSSEPGPGGKPLYEWIDVREVMSEAPSGD